jgi:hypothetical protein
MNKFIEDAEMALNRYWDAASDDEIWELITSAGDFASDPHLLHAWDESINDSFIAYFHISGRVSPLNQRQLSVDDFYLKEATCASFFGRCMAA